LGQKGQRESGGLDDPEWEVALAAFSCWSIIFSVGIVDKRFGVAQYLVSFLARSKMWKF